MSKTEKEFITEWYEKLLKSIKFFPRDFLAGDDFEEITLPDTRLTLGPDFFGEQQIMNSKGEVVLTLSSLLTAKYYLYAAVAGNSAIPIPKAQKNIDETVRSYEKYFMELVKKISKDYNRVFPSSDRDHQVAIDILQRLKLVFL
jgi:hypothetical protein